MWQVKKNGVVMAYGHEDTFPPADVRKSIEKAGYKIYVDGKVFKEKRKEK